jgi:hypothetical protein
MLQRFCLANKPPFSSGTREKQLVKLTGFYVIVPLYLAAVGTEVGEARNT